MNYHLVAAEPVLSAVLIGCLCLLSTIGGSTPLFDLYGDLLNALA